MPKHFEYSLLLSCRPETVFGVLTDPWLSATSNVLRDVEWKDGAPWQQGSTRIAETLVPFRSRHTQRVLARRENELLEVISHGFGYTMHTQIGLTRLQVVPGTEVHYDIDIEGKLPLLFGFAIEEFVSRFMEAHFAELKRLCQVPVIPVSKSEAA
jgi:Polyketide cyclase / dehydrase and lipid transport